MTRRIIAMATVFSLSAPLSAMAAGCLTQAEAQALQARQLHVQLQVASLNCRADDPSLVDKYGSYVHRFSSALTDNAKTLKTYFAKSGKGDAQRALDRHMTSLANDESNRAHTAQDYCESHVPLFDRLADVKPRDLEHFAATVIDRPAPLCGDGQASADKPKKGKS